MCPAPLHIPDLVFYAAPLVPVTELEERLDVVQVLRGELDPSSPEARSLALRERQSRAALAACRARDFSVKLRRSLSAKVLDLEEDARAAVRTQRRARSSPPPR